MGWATIDTGERLGVSGDWVDGGGTPDKTRMATEAFSFTPTGTTQTLAVTSTSGLTGLSATRRSRSLRRPHLSSPSRGQTPRPTYATVASS